jgi:small subunit ribosomal protein S7e
MSTDVQSRFYKRDFQKSPLTEAETKVAQTFKDIASASEIDLKDVYLSSVRYYDFSKEQKKGKSVYLVFVPYPSLNALLKVQRKLVVELEKRLRSYVLLTAKRTIQSKWIKTHKSQQRPRSRTLTSVFDAILDDFCLPTNIIGKRTRVQTDGKRFTNVYLDEADRALFGDRADKLEAITQIYKSITSRDIRFEFKPDVTFYTYKK